MKIQEIFFHYYLKKPYEFFLDKNSANLLQRCTNYVNSTVGGYITPSLLIFGNLLTGFLILFFLIIYNPLITIALLLSLSFLLSFFLSNKEKNCQVFISNSSTLLKHSKNYW